MGDKNPHSDLIATCWAPYILGFPLAVLQTIPVIFKSFGSRPESIVARASIKKGFIVCVLFGHEGNYAISNPHHSGIDGLIASVGATENSSNGAVMGTKAADSP